MYQLQSLKIFLKLDIEHRQLTSVQHPVAVEVLDESRPFVIKLDMLFGLILSEEKV